MTSLTSLRPLYCYLRKDFTHCFGYSIVDFQQVNTGWEGFYKHDEKIARHSKKEAYGLDFILKLLHLILT